MTALTHDNLYSLEHYSRIRPAFRAQVIEHKKVRRVPLGPNAALYFEDEMTMRYQVQEMLRLEKIFEADAIQAELDVYNPLIPDGSNWKATFMVEFEDVEERRAALARLVGIERSVWLQVEGHSKVYPIANEDLLRSTEDKTAAVHFFRFELTPAMVAALKLGAALHAGIDHPAYRAESEVSGATLASLVGDLRQAEPN